MADKVSICNLALSHIGENPSIVSVSPDEESEEAKACIAFYGIAKLKLLEDHDWSFATKYAKLSQLLMTDTHGYKAGYAVPSDCLRIQNLRDARVQESVFKYDTDFIVVNEDSRKILLTNCANPKISYTSSEVSEALFSPGFTDALAWLLASYVAGERIKGKEGASFARDCQQQYAAALSRAKTLDGFNTRNRTGFIPSWIRGR